MMRHSDKSQRFEKFITVPLVFICVLSLATPQPCLSFAPISNLPAQQAALRVTPTDIVIPHELASIKEQFSGTDTRLLVIHIQDAHAVFDAQKNIQLLIAEIERRFGPLLVGLEGGEGNLDSILFRAFPEKEIRETVFEQYLKRGEISGAEYAATINAISSRYYGVEDLHLYEENRLAFLNATRESAAAERGVLAWVEELNELRDKLYSPALLQLEKQIDAFRNDAVHIEPLLKDLATILPYDKYPAIARLISLSHEREPRTADTAFAEIDSEALESEVETYIADARKALYVSEDEKVLNDVSDKLRLLLNMSRLKLTKQEWKYYADHYSQFEPKSFESFLKRFGKHLDKHWNLRAHEQFYKLAYKRDGILTHNFLSLLKSKRAGVGIFISGGFHTDGLTHMLKKEDISYLVLTPKILSLNGASNYSNVMRGAVSYQDLLTVQDDALAPMLALAPHMSIHKSFRAHAAFQLTQQIPASKVLRVIRNWRDEVIRETFRQGRVESVRQYTRLIDEWYELLSNRLQTEEKTLAYDEIVDALEEALTKYTAAHFDEARVLLLEEFEKFADDLRRLSQEGNLSLETISALIDNFYLSSQPPAFIRDFERKAGFGLNKADLAFALNGLRDELQITEARRRDSDLRNAQLKIENERLLAEVTALRQLRNEAYTDTLTGLHNRRFYEERMGTLLALSQREDIPISLIAIDADRFKEVNDMNGHDVGDEVLKFIAEHLKRVARRRSDIGAARLGGEEFMIILPSTPLEQAAKIAERLRTNIASDSNRVTIKGTIPVTGEVTDNRSVTISAGVVQLKKGETAKDLYERADKALYIAKEQGRNRVVTESALNKASPTETLSGFGAVIPESEGGKPLETTIIWNALEGRFPEAISRYTFERTAEARRTAPHEIIMTNHGALSTARDILTSGLISCVGCGLIGPGALWSGLLHISTLATVGNAGASLMERLEQAFALFAQETRSEILVSGVSAFITIPRLDMTRANAYQQSLIDRFGWRNQPDQIQKAVTASEQIALVVIEALRGLSIMDILVDRHTAWWGQFIKMTPTEGLLRAYDSPKLDRAVRQIGVTDRGFNLHSSGGVGFGRITAFTQLRTLLDNDEIPLVDILARFTSLLETNTAHSAADTQAAKDILAGIHDEITRAVGEHTYQNKEELMEDLQAYAHNFMRFWAGSQIEHPKEWEALDGMLNRAGQKNGDNLKQLSSDVLRLLNRMIEIVSPEDFGNYLENAISEEEIRLSNMLRLRGREIVTNAVGETFAHFTFEGAYDFNIGAVILRGSVVRDQAVTWSDVDLDILTTDGKNTYISKFLEILEQTIYASLVSLGVERRTIRKFNILKVEMRSAYLEHGDVKTIEDLDGILNDIVDGEGDSGGKPPYIVVRPEGFERGFGILRSRLITQFHEMTRLKIQALARELAQSLKAVGHFEFFELERLLRSYGIELAETELLDLFVELSGIEFMSRETHSNLSQSETGLNQSARIEMAAQKMPNSDARRRAENKVAGDLLEKIALHGNPTDSVTIFYTLETFPRDRAPILDIAHGAGPHGKIVLYYPANESISFLTDLVSKRNPFNLTADQQHIILNKILRYAQTYTGRLETNKLNKIISSTRGESQGVAMIIPGLQVFDRGSVRQIRTEHIVVENPAIIAEFNWMQIVSSNLANRLAQLDGALNSARRRGEVEAIALLERQIAQLLSSLAEYGFERSSDGRGGRVITINLSTLLAKIQEAYTAFEQVRLAA